MAVMRLCALKGQIIAAIGVGCRTPANPRAEALDEALWTILRNPSRNIIYIINILPKGS